MRTVHTGRVCVAIFLLYSLYPRICSPIARLRSALRPDTPSWSSGAPPSNAGRSRRHPLRPTIRARICGERTLYNPQFFGKNFHQINISPTACFLSRYYLLSIVICSVV